MSSGAVCRCPGCSPMPHKFWLGGYAIIATLLLPLAYLRLAWCGLRDPAYLQGWRQRLGQTTVRPAATPRDVRIWLHAVSVGELRSLAPLIRRLRAVLPTECLYLTTTTPGGISTIRALWGDTIAHSFLPFDAPYAVRRFLGQLRPTLALVAENEIWPTLFAACHARNIPVALINARVSARSWRGYQLLSTLFRPLLSRLCLVAAQSELDAGRFRNLGVSAEQVRVPGNLKFDLELPAELDDRVVHIRKELLRHRPAWLAASTHEGEEAMLLRVLQRVRSEHPQLLLILAPRHPVRAEAVLQLCRREGFTNVARRSLGQRPGEGDAVYILDTLGELLPFCGATEVVFVGGSLVPHGGHNVLEPAALGIPILIGRHYHNFCDAVEALVEVGAARIVQDTGQLMSNLSQWLSDAELRTAAGRRGRQVIHANRGSTLRLLDDLAPWLPD